MSTVNSVTSSTSAAANQPVLPQQTLDQADFLKLLVTQMTSQDPLSPVSDTDMAAQMAQFSSLQAAQSTDTDVKILQANNFIGRTVMVSNTDGTQTSGVVSGVDIQAGTPEIIVNGQSYGLSQIAVIAPATTSTTAN